MSAFKKPLPLKIFSLENEKSNVFVKCFFESMETSHMTLRLSSPSFPFELGSDISIEFTVANHRYQFDSAVLSDPHAGEIFVRRPKVIYKKAL
jgi:hypothetical protein